MNSVRQLPAELALVDRGTPPPGPATFVEGALVLVDKPAGPGSFAMVQLLRRLAGLRRIGHAGTLDPFASGLMILLTGHATRWQETVMGADKRYTALFKLGVESDSHDRTGVILREHQGDLPDLDRIRELLPRFTGELEQIPPMHSAIQIGGQRLYKLAHKGITVERAPRRVVIHALEFLSYHAPLLELGIHCGKGMYVRSLARDLGRELGCGALVQELRRTHSGGYCVDRALDPDELRQRFADRVRGEDDQHVD